jgi:hypothetical protein
MVVLLPGGTSAPVLLLFSPRPKSLLSESMPVESLIYWSEKEKSGEEEKTVMEGSDLSEIVKVKGEVV